MISGAFSCSAAAVNILSLNKMTSVECGFENVKYSSSLSGVAEGQELWLIRMPRKFPVNKMPRKIKLDAHNKVNNSDTLLSTIKVAGKSYELKSPFVVHVKQRIVFFLCWFLSQL